MTEIERQVQILTDNGIEPIKIREMANMIVVKREDLEMASKLKRFDNITIARVFK